MLLIIVQTLQLLANERMSLFKK